MLLELMDVLRCPVAHEESWLVATVEEWTGRHVREGRLGCPVCRAEYSVRGGVAWLAPVGVVAPGARASGSVPEDADPVRLAALLGLTEPGGVVVLSGAYAGTAAALRELVPASYVLLNAAAVDPGPDVSAIVALDRVPLASGAVRALALDEPSPAALEDAVRVLGRGGRLVTGVRTPVPAGLRELARDGREWVAESGREVTGAPVPLVRRR